MESKLYITTVVTDSTLYFPYLKESIEKNNKKLNIIGINEKWKGFNWRNKKILEFLETLSDNDIVCNIDGYDVICCRNLNSLKDDFIKKKKNKNFKILIGKENGTKLDQEYLDSVFRKCQNNFICAGTYIGYVKDVKFFIKELLNYDNNNNSDDQILFTKVCKDHPNYFCIDENCEFFYNQTTCLKNILNNKDLCVINNELVYKNNYKQYFAHANCNGFLDDLIIKLEYKIKKKEKKNISFKLIISIIKKFIWYLKQFFYKYPNM